MRDNTHNLVFCVWFFGAFFVGGEGGRFLVAQWVKKSACSVEDSGSIPGLLRSPGRREWQPPPVFLPGEFHGQRNLVGYSPCGHKELDMTE